ncbi:vignain-like [Pyrus ussuriensis x Pyrus communis]|uniref:Vignain-like n=1 Tax=Pyrus ussuriensis x Pyrus communis TaxID=2448454 RepID=A0A5N5HDM7_9ROSA|nr:vignain-like [Pyrus ussuriensis x Pyrus communis]
MSANFNGFPLRMFHYKMAQASDESPMEYLTRFKSARNWCRVPLSEVEFVRIALNVLDLEYKKKFLGPNI